MNKINPPIGDKNFFREDVGKNIALLSQEEKNIASQKVFQELQKIIQERDIETIVTYSRLPDEIDVSNIGSWFSHFGEVVLIGQKGYFPDFPDTEKTLIIVPGRAFTKDGKRIGRGGGFYDKLLSSYRNVQTIGVGFMCQIYGNLPQDTWDESLDEVVFG